MRDRDRSQFFHAIWMVLPREGDTLCIQLLEYFKKGLDNPRLFPRCAPSEGGLCPAESITPLHPLCYEELPLPSKPGAASTAESVGGVGGVNGGSWYGSIEGVVQGTALIQSHFNHTPSETPAPSSRESLLDDQTYANHVRHYLDVFFNSSSTFLQILKTRRPQLGPDQTYQGPWQRYCVGGGGGHSHAGRQLSLPLQPTANHSVDAGGRGWAVFALRRTRRLPAVLPAVEQGLPAALRAE